MNTENKSKQSNDCKSKQQLKMIVVHPNVYTELLKIKLEKAIEGKHYTMNQILEELLNLNH